MPGAALGSNLRAPVTRDETSEPCSCWSPATAGLVLASAAH
jgi:hypothetical protein